MPLNATNYKTKIKYEGVFDMDGLYRFMREWLEYRRFRFLEKSYKSKVPTPLGSEVELSWDAWRKESEFMRYWVTVYFHFWDLEEVEVIREGRKVKMHKARFEIVFGGKLELDYQGRWDRTPLLKKLRDFYFKFVFTPLKEMGQYWDELHYYIYRFQSATKKFLGMHTSGNAFP